MKLFFHPNPTLDSILSEEESVHAIKVLRLKENDRITIIDGKGNQFEAKIISSNAKKCQFEVLEKRTSIKHPYFLHVAVAPTKSIDRIEWFIEKAIEIGIDEISFLNCAHSERKNINIERIEKIAMSAMKQSLNLYFPKINDIVPFAKFVTQPRTEAAYIAHLEDGERKYFGTEIAKKDSILLLIGPEGDFSKEEIKLALDSKYSPVNLGQSRLRTETAALAGCFITNTIKNYL